MLEIPLDLVDSSFEIRHQSLRFFFVEIRFVVLDCFGICLHIDEPFEQGQLTEIFVDFFLVNVFAVLFEFACSSVFGIHEP